MRPWISMDLPLRCRTSPHLLEIAGEDNNCEWTTPVVLAKIEKSCAFVTLFDFEHRTAHATSRTYVLARLAERYTLTGSWADKQKEQKPRKECEMVSIATHRRSS